MKSDKWKSYVFWILLSEAVGIIAGLLTSGGVEAYGMSVVKPLLTPPAIVFPIVWTILYALMGIGTARVAAAPESRGRSAALNVFVIQLIVNFFWSLIFFNARAFGLAFLWLLVLYALVIGMIVCFMKVDKWAGLLQIPYSLWLLFAGYLNLGIWLLN